jgi:hypothetical protein
MRSLAIILIALATLGVTASNAQTPPAGAAAAGTVKAIQPGLFEVAGPSVNDVIAAGITKIAATPGKGRRSIEVQSPWGDSFHGWPRNMKPVPFTITTSGAGTATISAPGFTEANKADYKAAIEKIVPFAINATRQNRNLEEGSDR